MAKYLRKQDLQSLELEHLAELPQPELKAGVVDLNLARHSAWVLPQLVACFGQWQVLEDVKETVIANTKTKFQQAIYRISRLPRSCLIHNQTREPQYGQFTPLILLGLKLSKGIPYSWWQGRDNLKYVLETQILEVVTQPPDPKLTRDELLQLRDQALLVRSGSREGEYRNPQSTWKMTGLAQTVLGDSAPLQQTALLQCWLAHPQIRHQNMLLNPYDWDVLPEPLVAANPLKTTKRNAHLEEILPWDLPAAV